MSLLRKTLLVVVATVSLYVLATVVASQATLLQGYRDLEETAIRSDLKRLSNSFDRIGTVLTSSLDGYANWDDTYQFAQDTNPAYIEANITPSIFNQLHVDFAAATNSAGILLFVQTFDRNAQETTSPPPELVDYLHSGS